MESLPHLLKTSPRLFFLGRLSCGADTELLSKRDQREREREGNHHSQPGHQLQGWRFSPSLPTPPGCATITGQPAGPPSALSSSVSQLSQACPAPVLPRTLPNQESLLTPALCTPQKPGCARPSPPQEDGPALEALAGLKCMPTALT